MISAREVAKTLAADKKRWIIEAYLKEKFKGAYNPAWLDTMDNYAPLGAAIDFFYKLDNDSVNLIAISSENFDTRVAHLKQFKQLESLLDELVVLTRDDPPVATSFKAKEAALVGIALNQALEGRSLRDLHAQAANLGIAEKLLNEELGQNEWLGEVDLERMLIKLGVRDRAHIARLNAEDIGMIMHFERLRHGASMDPYTIPLLINCGNSESLRSQGSHWTYAMVTVNPGTSTVSIDYQDSMDITGTQAATHNTLMNAINYHSGAYAAFPGYANKTSTETGTALQRDGWSCGYRALRGLLTDPGFPHGGVDQSPEWLQFTTAPLTSADLRDVVYQQLLSGLEISPDYFVAMQLDREMVESASKESGFKLSSKFTDHYLKLLSKPQTPVLTTENFAKEYFAISVKLDDVTTVETARRESVEKLKKQLGEITSNKLLSPDAKLMAVLNVLATEYAEILGTRGGKNSKLGKALSAFCLNNFNVVLGANPLYTVSPKGLTARVLNQLLRPTVDETESLLPPVSKKSVETTISVSAPVIGSGKTSSIPTPQVSQSADVGRRTVITSGEPSLRVDKQLTRLGSMFGTQQFCYANKPGGVEPGFRAVDLNALFFKELDTVLGDNLASTTKISLKEKRVFDGLREELNEAGANLDEKRRIFAKFVNSQVPGPHPEGLISTQMQWMCDAIKGCVANNNNLSAWMYKLDYADKQKDRVKANKEAIREFVGTRLAGIFSADNQKQEITWVRNGEKGSHALLACGWKNGLQELTQFLHGGGEPNYNGVLVEDKNAAVKRSKQIPGLGKNLIFGIAIGDRDGMGKEAQNKGFADGKFYGFDYGKPYEGEGVTVSLDDDFSFVDKFAKAPSIFRGSSIIGFARHYMYRNYSSFYDTPLAERMEGLHLLRKMILGVNPSDEVIKSFPGLRQELNRIQENTPTPPDMVNQLRGMRTACSSGSPYKNLIDNQILELCSGKVSTYDMYFTKMKIDLVDVAIKNNMPYEELCDYLKFIDEMALQAEKSNQLILAAFAERVLLSKPEIDLIDKLEKILSPTSAMSHDGTVFLNTLRFDPVDKRVPFQLTRNEKDNTYTLSTPNVGMAKQLRKEFGLKPIASPSGLNCHLTQKELLKLMAAAEFKYNDKREGLLVTPTCQAVSLPQLKALLNKYKTPDGAESTVRYMWRKNGSLLLQIIARTQEQALVAEQVLRRKIVIGKEVITEIPEDKIRALVHVIKKASQAKVIIETPELGLHLVETPSVEERTSKWARLHQQSERSDKAVELSDFRAPPRVIQLIDRMRRLIPEGNKELYNQVKDAISDIGNPDDIQGLLAKSDKTLSAPENIKAIIEERLQDIRDITEELTVTTTTVDPSATVQLRL